MNRILFTLAALCLMLAPQISHAYDIDTHFYHTYSMARYAGIGHDVALFLATADQWADESPLTSPLKMPTDPMKAIEFLRKQRFVHFGCSLRVEKNASILDLIPHSTAVIPKIDGATLEDLINILTCNVSGEGNDSFASEIIMTGLRKGDLLIAGAGLHTLQDSYAHAGYPNHEGHAAHGHWPDRPFQRVPFYEDMIHTFFKALVAIRTMLPPNALEQSNANMKINATLDAETLARGYLSQTAVQNTINFNPLRESDEYGTKVFNGVIHRAVKEQLLAPSASSFQVPGLMEQARQQLGENDVLPTKMLELWVAAALENQKRTGVEIINMDVVRIRAVPGLPVDSKEASLPPMTPDEQAELIKRAVLYLTENFIPRPVTGITNFKAGVVPDYHPIEIEAEGSDSAYNLESRIRVDKYKQLIAYLYGVSLDFGGDTATGGSRFLLRVAQPDRDNWNNFFNTLIVDGTEEMLKRAAARTLFNKDVSGEDPLFQAEPGILSYQYPDFLKAMARDGQILPLATPARIQGIAAQNKAAGYSEATLRQLLINQKKANPNLFLD